MDAESPDKGGAAVALEFPTGDSPAKVPLRIRRRLLEGRGGGGPASVEEIEAKLKEADLRRQQFHEWLSSKARPKPRSPSWSSQEDDLGQRLEAKLNAAEQKRLNLLTKAQMRLARLDELRQAAKTGVEIRYEKEREELGTRVESRVQQAEANRMRLLKDHMQRRAAVQERKARLLTQRMIRENKYKECVRSAIFQKRVAAEKKRLRLLEEEKTRVHARVMQVRRVAKTVYHRRESERRNLKEKLENRLQRARRQRAEYLRQRGSPQSSAHIIWNKHGDVLARKLARCWRQFVRLSKTTFSLAKSYAALGINEKVAKSMPFEQLALRIESAATLQAVKALLDRLESRFFLTQLSSSSNPNPENIDHLLKRLASPIKRTTPNRATRTRGVAKKGSNRELRNLQSNKLSRYPVRVVLCAYMILGHPNAVFSGQGEREVALRDSAANFVREFELMVKIILDGCSSRLSSPDFMSDDCDHQESSVSLPRKHTFRSQLSAFDATWRSYLYCFVVWKIKDARSLEDDLVRTACQLELSMMQTCKLTSGGQTCDLTHDMKAVQKQVTEDQKLLREKVLHLGGSAGVVRMESALSETRSKFFEEKDTGPPSVSPVAQVPSLSPSSSSVQHMDSESNGRSSHVVRSLFGNASSPVKVGTKTQSLSAEFSCANSRQPPTENEVLVNEIVHGGWSTSTDKEETGLKSKIKETMEKAFWDGIIDSLKEDSSDYSRIVGLVKEVRDELSEMAPQNWKKEILDSIDLDILSQLLESGTQDTEYLGRIMEYALVMVQKLSAPAKEAEMKKAHNELLNELASMARSDGKEIKYFFIAVIKGLRFVLEEIQTLKKEISRARIQMMEPIIKGSAGMEYLQKAFAERYGPPAAASLPLTVQWISSLGSSTEEEWNEHNSLSPPTSSHGLPIGTALRTGGSIPLAGRNSFASDDSGDDEKPECSGEKLDILLRLGLLKLASGIEGLTKETVPETLELNVLRLRSVQSQLQQIIVVSTSMLVLRQILLSEKLVASPSEMESTISDTYERLFQLLDSKPDLGIEEIVDAIAGSSSDAKLQGLKEMIARMLTRSLQSNDAVFLKVSRSIYLAARALVLGGSGEKGVKQADVVLRRVGASILLDRVVKAAKVLIVVATVSGHVHEPWYRCLV
ncbi:uncharacterized protein M6B38_394315 [Iris pallida]|uniref:T-complex protein 11 n=1 Tax=Iris pallida TaxID=29817 RepID=A0AAX6FX86_IRIPA|nr:uncharacterized protein M6B38_394315 [Iris pallida]